MAKLWCKKGWNGICHLRFLHLENIWFLWYYFHFGPPKVSTIFVSSRLPPYNDLYGILAERKFQLWRWHIFYDCSKWHNTLYHVWLLLCAHIERASSIVFKEVNNELSNDPVLRDDRPSLLSFVPWGMQRYTKKLDIVISVLHHIDVGVVYEFLDKYVQ